MLSKMIDPDEFTSLRDQFNRIDIDGSATIQVEEIKAAFIELKIKISDKEIE